MIRINSEKSLSLAQNLASSFLDRGLLSSDQLDIVYKEQKIQGTSFEECLLNLGFVTENVLSEILSVTSGYQKVNLKQSLLDPSLKDLISQKDAARFCLIPLSFTKGSLEIAISDIYNLPALDYLKNALPSIRHIVPRIANESDILEAIDHFYGYDLSIRGLLQELETPFVELPSQDGSSPPTIRLVNAILVDGIKKNASDIHFEPEGPFMRLRYRIDGILTQISTLHTTYWPSICVRLKVMAEMNIAETRRPQNGRITFYLGTREIDLRVASHPTIHGENIVIRILDKSRSLLTLDDLGYTEHVRAQILTALNRPEGLFILTGPTGSGKTTSLYSLLNYLNTPCLNIMTLEEPVEYQLPLIRQSQIRDNAGMDFPEGIRSILRQDPDIILIGEIRDSQTAQMALRASMTGHQVFSILHTHDALGAISRLLDLGLTHSMLASHMGAVVAQRLVRKLCSFCKKERKVSQQESHILSLKKTPMIFQAKGCSSCGGTGYRGRFALAECLVFDQDLENLLLMSPSRRQLKELAKQKGYRPMQQDARMRILKGDTSLEEVLRVVDLRQDA